MRVIAVANQKGGTAKTTTAVHLAAALGERGVQPLLVDLDPQASASQWLGADDGGDELLELLTGETDGELADLARPTTAPGVDLVPASPALIHAERDLARQPAGALSLRHLVAELPARWPLVLLDCPPQLGQLATSALLAAGALLVPVEASAMALAGLAELVKTTGRFRRANPGLHLAGIVACRVDYRTLLSRHVVTELWKRFPGIAFRTVIRERVALREAWSHRQPVTLYDPDGDAAADYRALAAEFLARIEDDAA
jgi:chromosome partitioning protein